MAAIINRLMGVLQRLLPAMVVLAAWLISFVFDAAATSALLAQEVEGLLHRVSVTGREGPAVQYIKERLGDLPAIVDEQGSLTVTFGSGAPRRLVACALDEPGYVVSHIREDGYLRLSRAGREPLGTLWDQAHAGQAVVVVTEQGLVPGAIGVQSIHLTHGHPEDVSPFNIDQAYVDVGAESAAEVDALGIRLLDAVALMRRPVRFANGMLAAPAARAKAACVAMIHAARRVAQAAPDGTVVFAWTVLERLGRRGLERVVGQLGPFAEVVLLSNGFGWQYRAGAWALGPLPSPGSGLLVAGDLVVARPHATATAHMTPPAGLYTGAPRWGTARLGYLGLPARYPDTPVELIDLRDVIQLVDALLVTVGATSAASMPALPLSPPLPLLIPPGDHAEIVEVLAELIAAYGVSGAEGAVRDRIRAMLPAWAQPHIDAKGNLLVTFGSGTEHLLFVAHMDEVGFQVTTLLEDGRLLLRPRGGLYASLWEAQAGLVHTDRGPVPAVFEPRSDWHAANRREPAESLGVYVGANSPQEVEALGITVGQTVTMPKQMLHLGRHRVLARSLDDRVGSAALLVALHRIDVNAVGKRFTFAWVVEEEVGLGGSRILQSALPDVTRVYPVDTFVSSDTPLESRRFAYVPLGRGAVIRAMDSGNIVPRPVIDAIQRLAQSQAIPLQYGMTGGWTDGTPFLPHGVVNVPLSWPGRYSHSPVEVADLRDIEAMLQLLITLVMQ
jgi:putative aminopeptidase FrvX